MKIADLNFSGNAYINLVICELHNIITFWILINSYKATIQQTLGDGWSEDWRSAQGSQNPIKHHMSDFIVDHPSLVAFTKLES